MPVHGVCKNIMIARQKDRGYGTLQNPERFRQQDYLQLKQMLLTQNKLFRDEAFPADQRSIGQDKPELQWLRPRDIVTNPSFILDGVSRFDFGQGKVGNCWFLASLGALTFHKEIFKLIVPMDQTCLGKDYCGLFHFRFWRFGKWVDVVIDDKLPTVNRKPIFAHSKDECEFWPALLEKAYAKVCGSYADMTSGTPAEAMRDFTGGVHMCIQLSDPSPNLWKLLCRAGRSKTFMSCSSNPKTEATTGDTLANGLVPGHAYTVTGLKELQSQEATVNLVRLWNPWGHGEWTGDWSDRSPLWRSVSTKDREKCLKVENDGEFWMSLEDCCRYYTNIEICGMKPDFLDEDSASCHWKTSMYENRWVAGTTAGGYINHTETFWTNPQYRIKVCGKPNSSQTRNTLVSLMQKPDKRNRRSAQFFFIGFIIFEVSEKDEKRAGKFPASFFSSRRPVAQTRQLMKSREVTEFLTLKPGEFVIVPCTDKPDQTAGFLLTICSREETRCYENSGHSFNSPVGKVKKEKNCQDVENKMLLLRQYSDKYEEVDAELLQQLLKGDLISGSFSIDACRSMVALMDESGDGKLDSQEFGYLWHKVTKYKQIFAKVDVSQTGTLSLTELRNALRDAGLSISDELLHLMAVRYGASSGHMTLENFISLGLRLSRMNKTFTELSDGKDVTLSKSEWLFLSMYT